MDVKPYQNSDRAACLAVFESLTPAFIGSAARSYFEQWLDKSEGAYFVLEHEESIVGCGGYLLSVDRTGAVLRWGMIRSDSRNLGLGRYLLMYRIREIGKEGTVDTVVADVPHPSVSFYEKQGFRVHEAPIDGFTPGGDWRRVVKRLTVCV